MLIEKQKIIDSLYKNKINITGVFHIGAHECEEIDFYNSKLNLNNSDMVWVDAFNSKVIQAQKRGIPNVYNAVITDENDQDIIFNVANNIQSSSVLEFGTHSEEHPHITFVDKIQQKSITIDTFF